MNLQIERDGVQFGLVDVPRDRDGADRKSARAYPPRGRKLDGEVELFCSEVGNLTSFDYGTTRRTVRALPLPSGYAHFRLFLVGEPQPFHRSFQVEHGARPMTVHDVLFGVLEWTGVEVTAWSGIRAMPDAIPGVLDLELSVSTKPACRPVRLRT